MAKSTLTQADIIRTKLNWDGHMACNDKCPLLKAGELEGQQPLDDEGAYRFTCPQCGVIKDSVCKMVVKIEENEA